jgi:hypothetical protein
MPLVAIVDLDSVTYLGARKLKAPLPPAFDESCLLISGDAVCQIGAEAIGLRPFIIGENRERLMYGDLFAADF